MHSTDIDQSLAIQSLIVYTDPVCVFTLDVVDENVTSAAAVAERVAARLEIEVTHAEAVLDGLIGVGFVERTGLDGVAPVEGRRASELMQVGIAHAVWLRDHGDEEHAFDIVGAIYAAWDLRSDVPYRRRKGERFRDSEAGRRFEQRRRAGTVGEMTVQEVGA